MHITEFLAGFCYRSPTREKARLLAKLKQGRPPPSGRPCEFEELYLGEKALDDYMTWLIGGTLHLAGYANYPLSALINFASHQLTMRRFEHTGMHRLVQVGTYSGGELRWGTLRNVSIRSTLVAPVEAIAFNDDLPCARLPWEEGITLVYDPLEQYLRTESPAVGVLIAANLGRAERYLETIEMTWNHLTDFADVIVCGAQAEVLALREELIRRDRSVTPAFIRQAPFAGTTDDAILLVQRARVDYAQILAEEVR